MRWSHVWHLGIKEFYSLGRDPVLLVLIVYSFTVAIYAAATAMPETLSRASIAIVDEDRSPGRPAHHRRLPAALFPAAGDDHPGRDGRPHG